MIFFDFFFFLMGATFGSFANVLIHRMPNEEDIVLKRSHCPNCKTNIPWYLNIPIIGFLILRGKCHHCKKRIEIRYLLVELSVGLMGWHLAPNQIALESLVSFFIYISIFTVFVAHFVIDLKHQLLLDKLNIYLALIFLAISALNNSWTFWVLGGLIGFVIPWLVTWIFYKLKGQVGLGGGDIKLFGALGIYLGPIVIIQNIFFSCFLGSIVGLTLIATKKMNKNNPIPFGPFILIVATIQIFFYQQYAQVLNQYYPTP